MKNNLKKYLVFCVSLFFLTLLIPLLFLHQYNLKKLQTSSIMLSASFKKYLAQNKTILNIISSDQIIKSSLLQYFVGENLKSLQKRVNEIKSKYKSVRFISVYNKDGDVFLSTDYFEKGKTLNIKKILNSKQKFTIEYFLDFNQYLCLATVPLSNEFNMKIGYISVAFSLVPFWDSLKFDKEYLVFLYQNSRKLLAYPLDTPIFDVSNPYPTKNYTMIKINKTKYYQTFLSDFSDQFSFKVLYKYHNKLFLFFLIFNIILFLIILGLLIAYFVQYKIAVHDEFVKKNTDQLLQYSQQTLKNVSLVKDTLDDLNYKREILSQSLVKVKSFSTGVKNNDDEFKIIEPE